MPAARAEVIAAAVDDPRLGATLRHATTAHLEGLAPEDLAPGADHRRRRTTSCAAAAGLAYQLMGRGDFVVPPLPNLLFTRDSSVWVGDQVAVTSLAMPARQPGERAHRRDLPPPPALRRDRAALRRPRLEHLEGGDVLLLAPGVLAVGVGERTTPAGAERLARRAVRRGPGAHGARRPDRAGAGDDAPGHHLHDGRRRRRGHVPGRRRHAAGVDGHRRRRRRRRHCRAVGAGPQPFLAAAAAAMGIDRLRIIDTGLDPVTAEREQWDDGNNTLALAPRLAVAYERNIDTNAALEAAGIEVIAHRRLELGSGRGGPRCMSCPVLRDPLPASVTAPGKSRPRGDRRRSRSRRAPVGHRPVRAARRPARSGRRHRVSRSAQGPRPDRAAARARLRSASRLTSTAPRQQQQVTDRPAGGHVPGAQVAEGHPAEHRGERRAGTAARPPPAGAGRRRRGSRRPGPGSRRRSRGPGAPGRPCRRRPRRARAGRPPADRRRRRAGPAAARRPAGGRPAAAGRAGRQRGQHGRGHVGHRRRRRPAGPAGSPRPRPRPRPGRPGTGQGAPRAAPRHAGGLAVQRRESASRTWLHSPRWHSRSPTGEQFPEGDVGQLERLAALAAERRPGGRRPRSSAATQADVWRLCAHLADRQAPRTSPRRPTCGRSGRCPRSRAAPALRTWLLSHRPPGLRRPPAHRRRRRRLAARTPTWPDADAGRARPTRWPARRRQDVLRRLDPRPAGGVRAHPAAGAALRRGRRGGGLPDRHHPLPGGPGPRRPGRGAARRRPPPRPPPS